MKTTKKYKKKSICKTRKRNVKRKSRKATKTHKRKYRNKRYDGGNEDEETEDEKTETGFGFDDPADQPGDPVYNNQDDETTSCPRGHDSVERKGKVCNTCIPYLKKIFILRYNELKGYIDKIESAIKDNHKEKLINDESSEIYNDFIKVLRKQCTDIYNEATDVNKTYNLEDWINYINRVGGQRGEIATRLDEQIYGVSIKTIGNVPKNEDKPTITLPNHNKPRSFFGKNKNRNRNENGNKPVIEVLHRIN